MASKSTNDPNKPDKPARSLRWRRLRGIGDFGLGLKRDWFSLGSGTPHIEEDGDQHVAQDVNARAGSGRPLLW